MKKNAVVIHPEDCVATAVQSLVGGEEALMFAGEREVRIVLREAIPVGHKFAIRQMPFHTEVLKYGESIGRATRDIEIGDYVHVHNVESERGRGDWKQ